MPRRLLSGATSLPANSIRAYSTIPLLSSGSVPPKGTPTSPSAKHSPLGQLVGAAPLIVRPPQSPICPSFWSTWFELVIMMGCSAVPAALILEPRRKTSADTLSGESGLGGFLPTTSAPGWIVTVTPGWTTAKPSTSTRHPVVQTWLMFRFPVTVVRVVQLSPPGPEPGFETHGIPDSPSHRPTSVGFPTRCASNSTT